MPAVSQAQRGAMAAAAAGKSTLDIPQSVGRDFMNADKGGKLPAKKGQAKRKKDSRSLGQRLYGPNEGREDNG